MYTKAKLFGHPIHPMLIAFPVAFYTSTLVLFIVYAATRDVFWCRVATVANWAGVVMGATAAVPGFIDWATGIPRGTEAKNTGLQHMALNASALVLFLINAIIYANRWNHLLPNANAGIVLSLLGIGLTLPAGFLGWKLVQDHHVGIHLTAEQERLEPQPAIKPQRTIDVSKGIHHT